MKAKKSLGQNWLRSESAREAILKAAELKPNETILEIGPGRGFLTEALLASGAKVVAVEKDDRLITELREMFKPELKSRQLVLIHKDILLLGTDDLPKKYKLVANIPYYITGQLLQKFLTAAHQPSRMVLMLQKEVAQRICAKDSKESILSLSVKIFGEPKYVRTVPKGSFAPQPSVDSAILLIKNVSRDRLEEAGVEEELFFDLVKRGFAHKRKLLSRNLGLDAEKMAQAGLNSNVRAEDVTLDQWVSLCKSY